MNDALVAGFPEETRIHNITAFCGDRKEDAKMVNKSKGPERSPGLLKLNGELGML